MIWLNSTTFAAGAQVTSTKGRYWSTNYGAGKLTASNFGSTQTYARQVTPLDPTRNATYCQAQAEAFSKLHPYSCGSSGGGPTTTNVTRISIQGTLSGSTILANFAVTMGATIINSSSSPLKSVTESGLETVTVEPQQAKASIVGTCVQSATIKGSSKNSFTYTAIVLNQDNCTNKLNWEQDPDVSSQSSISNVSSASVSNTCASNTNHCGNDCGVLCANGIACSSSKDCVSGSCASKVCKNSAALLSYSLAIALAVIAAFVF